nr:reverse transcriptase domain-containing protein [Tanacetum cinerariifolium]
MEKKMKKGYGRMAVHPKPVTSPISEPTMTPVSTSRPNPQASIPYPSRRNDERNRERAKDQIEKFYQIFKDMSFEISFADALMLMPKFASTLKALIGNKEKLSEMAWTSLNEHCSAVLLKKLPEKLGDLGKFLIPCDFPVVDFDADPRVPLILGRSFLKTGKALIDVFEGELTLRVGKEAITFNLDQTSRYSANYNDMIAKLIDLIDMACEEYSQEVLGFSNTISSGNPTPGGKQNLKHKSTRLTSNMLKSATITAAAPQLTTAGVPTLTTAPSAARRRNEVVIIDLEETATPSTIIHSEAKSKVQRKKKEDNAVMRHQALKRKPHTEAQARKNMMIYLRNMTGFKINFFKGMKYDDIRLIFEKYFNSNVDFLEKTKEQMEEEDNRALKRISETQEEKAAKKQKLDEEVAELKRHLQIVTNNEDDVYTKATPLARNVPVVDYEIYTKNNKP